MKISNEFPPGKREDRENSPIIITAPPAESLLSLNSRTSLWPESVTDNPELQHEAAARKELLGIIEDVFASGLDGGVDMKQSIESGSLEPLRAVELYEKMRLFMEREPYNARVILYLPFEILPPKDWQPESQPLSEAIERFTSAYMNTWRELLSVHDVRTNFADGDTHIREDMSREFSRVSKAAHFVPELARKGMLSVREALVMIEQSQDTVLRESIADTLTHMRATGLLSAEDRAYMEASQDAFVRNMAKIIESERSFETASDDAGLRSPTWLADLQEDMSDNIAERTSEREANEATLAPSRKAWEAKRDEQEIVEQYAKELEKGLAAGILSADQLSEFMRTSGTEATLASIRALGMHLEKAENAKELYAAFEPIITELWKSGGSKERDAVESVLARLNTHKVIDDAYLERLGIFVPTLEEDFQNQPENLKTRLTDFEQKTRVLASDPLLAESVYPVSIVSGSVVKGYATRYSDTDIAIFVRPGMRTEDRERMSLRAQEILGTKPLEFWLEERDGELCIKDFGIEDISLGNDRLANTLFNGVWCGDTDSMRELHEQLLAPYLASNERERAIRLEDIERGTLQYRLMHRGYERFYPTKETQPASEEMDGTSAFWDPGYRRLATKLFIKKVFLPKLIRP